MTDRGPEIRESTAPRLEGPIIDSIALSVAALLYKKYIEPNEIESLRPEPFQEEIRVLLEWYSKSYNKDEKTGFKTLKTQIEEILEYGPEGNKG